jgi:hypothetical protein
MITSSTEHRILTANDKRLIGETKQALLAPLDVIGRM